MLEIFNVSTDQIRSMNREELLSLCTPERKARILSMKHEQSALLMLGAGYLEDKMLSKCPSGTEILIGEQGKPYLSCPGLFYNLSHSGNHVVLAFADAEVGIDLQEPRGLSEGMQQRILTENEKRSGLYRLPSEWFLLFSVKESYMKLTGRGLSLDFCRIDVIRDPDGVTGEIRDLKGEYQTAGFHAERFANDYHMAVSIYKPETDQVLC